LIIPIVGADVELSDLILVLLNKIAVVPYYFIIACDLYFNMENKSYVEALRA